MFKLKPADENILHPEAIRWFNARRAEIQIKVPLEELSDDDLHSFLSDSEKREFQNCKDKIIRGLHTCIKTDYTSHDPVIDAFIDLNVTKFRLDSWLAFKEIGSLLKDVYQRKVAKAKQEQREQEEIEKRRREQAEVERREKEAEEKRQAAYEAVNPPLDDAKRYLNEKEYDEFLQAVLGAIEVCREKGEEYLDDMRTYDYRKFLKRINERKEEEKRKTTARLRAQEYNQLLTREITKLKALLCPDRTDHEDYFKKQIKDRRYTGQSFARYLSREEATAFDKIITNISRRKIDEMVSSDFRQFITSRCFRSYFPLPSAEYSLKGVPCLNFMFDIFAVVETRVWLKPGQKNLGNYIFNLPWRYEKGCPVLVQEPEFLGYHYLVLMPNNLSGYISWQIIPVVLIRQLLNGERKPGGLTITSATKGMITYKIPKHEDIVNIPDDFAEYLGSIGSIDEMVNMGIITQNIADIAKTELSELKVEQIALLSQERGQNSKRARAFQFFAQGKGPSSPEVKTLGLHKSTRFKYYNQYLSVYKR